MARRFARGDRVQRARGILAPRVGVQARALRVAHAAQAAIATVNPLSPTSAVATAAGAY
jgi:hypothetical protein